MMIQIQLYVFLLQHVQETVFQATKFSSMSYKMLHYDRTLTQQRLKSNTFQTTESIQQTRVVYNNLK